MKSSVESLEGNKVKLYVEVEEEEFEHDIDRAFKAIAREINMPGFRAGKAPRRVLEARIGVGPAREQALRDSIPQYLAKAVREHDVDLIDTPEIEITGGQETGPVEFDATCEVRPEVEVPGYGGLRVELPVIDVDDEALDAAMDEEIAKHGTLADVDRPAAEGDYLTLDVSASRDGEPVPGLNAEDWSYELGQGWVSDDFDEHLTGASAGDELTFTSTPKGTDSEAEMTVKVTRVQEMVRPEVDDEWVVENLGEFDTVDEWRESVRERLQEEKLFAARRELGPKLSASLARLVDVEVPEALVNRELQQRVQGVVQQFQSQGIDLEAWLSATGQSADDFIGSMRGEAEESVKTDLALRAVADAEGLDVEGHDVEMEYARIAMQVGQKAKEVRKAYEKNDAVPELMARIRTSKAFDWLLHHVEMVDTNGKVLDRDLVLGHDHDDEDHDDEPAADGGADVVDTDDPIESATEDDS